MHRDEFKRETLLTLCTFKSINVNLKPYMYISLLDSSEIASSSPSLRLGAWFGGPGRGWRSSAETSGRTDKLTEGQPGGLDPASPALPAVPNSRAAPRAAVRSAAPPPAPGSQWGAREEGGAREGWGGRGGARLQKAEHRDTLLRARSRGTRKEVAESWAQSACGPGGHETMLRVRCLRGGSRGAEAVHYIGSRVRAPPPHRAAACSLPPLLSWLSPASLARPCPFWAPLEARLQEPLPAAGSLAVSQGKGACVGATPSGHSCGLRASGCVGRQCGGRRPPQPEGARATSNTA